jgi:hypothetical protein
MKKILLSIIAAGTVVTSQAQAPKEGSILVYGNIGISTIKSDYDPGIAGSTAITEYKVTTFSVNPGIGYQFNRNWTVGINFGLSTQKRDSSSYDPYSQRDRDLNIGPFIRYTMNLNKTFFFYDQLNLNYLNGRRLIEGAVDIQNTYNGFGTNLYPAIGVSVNDRVALNFNFGGIAYSSKKWDLDASPATRIERGFAFTFGQQVNVGVSINLGGNRRGHHCCGGHMEPGEEMRHHDKDTKKEKEDDDDDDK